MRRIFKFILFPVIISVFLLTERIGLGHYIDLVIDWDERKIALTIDDVPCPETNLILDILDEEGVKATFFVVGELAVKYPWILRRIVSEGHEVGNHTMSHPLWLTRKSTFEIFEEVWLCSDVIEEITGIMPKFFRPPQGLINDDIESATQAQRLEIFLWSRGGDSTFWVPVADGRDPAESLPEDAVLLLHGGEPDFHGEAHGRNDTPETVLWLKPLIKKLKAAGFSFVLLEEMRESSAAMSM